MRVRTFLAILFLLVSAVPATATVTLHTPPSLLNPGALDFWCLITNFSAAKPRSGVDRRGRVPLHVETARARASASTKVGEPSAPPLIGCASFRDDAIGALWRVDDQPPSRSCRVQSYGSRSPPPASCPGRGAMPQRPSGRCENSEPARSGSRDSAMRPWPATARLRLHRLTRARHAHLMEEGLCDDEMLGRVL